MHVLNHTRNIRTILSKTNYCFKKKSVPVRIRKKMKKKQSKMIIIIVKRNVEGIDQGKKLTNEERKRHVNHCL